MVLFRCAGKKILEIRVCESFSKKMSRVCARACADLWVSIQGSGWVSSWACGLQTHACVWWDVRVPCMPAGVCMCMCTGFLVPFMSFTLLCLTNLLTHGWDNCAIGCSPFVFINCLKSIVANFVLFLLKFLVQITFSL